MDPNTLKILQGAAGAAGDSTIGVEDVFKTYLWKGNATARSINTGIDMTKGGMVWFKDREDVSYHMIFDTERGATKALVANEQDQESTESQGLTAFNNNGFSIGTGDRYNRNNSKICAWSFRKQKKFFDIVTYTGNNNSNHQISHNLGSVPGMIIIKCLGVQDNWAVYHRGVDSSSPQNYALYLNDNAGRQTGSGWWNDTAPTSTHFTVGSGGAVNEVGESFVAYLFAHEEAEFGPNSDQKIISCGSYTGNGSSTGPEITLPFEPGYILVKKTDSGDGWVLCDSMRGMVSNKNDTRMQIHTSSEELGSADVFDITSTGFKIMDADSRANQNTKTYIYIAIAAETGKTSKAPENGTDVFGMDHGNGSSTNFPNFDSTFPVDLALNKVNQTTGTGAWYLSTRISEGYVRTDTDTQASSGSWVQFDSSVGWALSDSYGASSSFSHMWKRYAGLDCLHHTGTGSAGTISHNLGQTPEMIWIKRRDFWQGSNWVVGHKGLNGGTNPWNYYLVLNGNNAEGAQSAYFNDTAPTSSVFTLGSAGGVNASGSPFTIILFSSVEGISKVGSYDGSSSTVTVTTGFQPRFVIIKRATGVGQWSVFDTTRGWGSGNDQLLELSDSAAQTNNYDAGAPTSTGFTVTSGQSAINNNGDKYIYYAHA